MNILRQDYGTKTEWERFAGCSRAIRIGNMVSVSGTAATDEKGDIVGEGDPYAQTIQILRNIERALAVVGARLYDVIRTRMHVKNMDHWEEIGRAHGEVFGDIRPATSMIEVSRLMHPRTLVEIEADAIVP